VIGLLFLQTTYFTNYILGLTPYLVGPVVYVAFLYVLSFFAWRNPQIFSSHLMTRKYRNINFGDEDLSRYKSKLTKLMEEEKLYLDNNCTIKQVADQINLPVYLVSHLINKEFAQGFSDLLNSYRVREAKELFLGPQSRNFKISAIASDSGFNSLSSFNIAFKKHTGMTPSSYRKQMMDL